MYENDTFTLYYTSYILMIEMIFLEECYSGCYVGEFTLCRDGNIYFSVKHQTFLSDSRHRCNSTNSKLKNLKAYNA